MREAMLYEEVADSAVRCHVCQWRCVIRPHKSGLCQVRQNIDGVFHILNYAEVSSVAVDPIEKKPLFHFHPTRLVFSLGGWGCNFHCKHCQNWQISCRAPREERRGSQQIFPDASIGFTKRHGCEGITWTYNEPGICVTRFYPQHELQHIPPTPVSTIERAYSIGQRVGLRFIYVGNLHGHEGENTTCYSCGRLLVKRVGYQTELIGLGGSKCRFCGAELNLRIRS